MKGWRGGTSSELKGVTVDHQGNRRRTRISRDEHKTPWIGAWVVHRRNTMIRVGWRGVGQDKHDMGFRQMPFLG